MRVQFHNSRFVRVLFHPLTKVVLALAIIGAISGACVFGYYYVRFARLIDRRLAGGVFARTSKIYAAPETIFVEQPAAAADMEARLRRSGYSDSKTNRIGWYQEVKGGLEIFPGPDSYFQDEPVLVRLSGGAIQKIVSLRDNTEQQQYDLEPELITNLFDRSREKRRLIRFEDLPPNFVNAVLAAEDKGFFQRVGPLDLLRILAAGYEDVKAGKRVQGASTLTQQLARGFFLTPTRTFSRKLAEAMIALQLERRLTKNEIFEFYCNQIYLGQRGSFSINGFGEASLAYFGKDVKQLTLPEAAMLAGIIRGPNVYNPYKYPDRVKERRNLVLRAMCGIGAITERERDEAMAVPIKVIPPFIETGDAPYFVDLVREQLLENHDEKDLVNNGYRVYTTLDMNLQRAAGEAIRVGIQLVDEQLAKKRAKYPQAQVALVCIDPHTGEVKALAGGRAYGVSQLNRAVAMRQPGSAFKPFVYATAFESAIDGTHPLITPVTVVDDSPTTFVYDGGTYEPNNYKEHFRGPVTAQEALAHSLNVATVKIGEMAGWDKIALLAQTAGLKNARATPAVALGAYEATPLDVAGAYTVFANGGMHVDPLMIRVVKSQAGEVIENHKATPRDVLDPRIAGLMTAMMEGVIQYGTGAGVRARGFTAPAAGKTGTSHDGWFAGYTSNLLCVVWVGFDDNEELPLEGARSALPIWAEFMKRASALRQYRDMVPFDEPAGVATVDIDPASGQLATPYCPEHRLATFIEGSQPTEVCVLHTLPQIARPRAVLTAPPPALPPAPLPAPSREAAPASSHVAQSPPGAIPGDSARPPAAPASQQPQAQADKKKRNLFSRIWGAVAGSSDSKTQRTKRQ